MTKKLVSIILALAVLLSVVTFITAGVTATEKESADTGEWWDDETSSSEQETEWWEVDVPTEIAWSPTFLYDINSDGTACITGYDDGYYSSSSYIDIPSTIYGYTVTSIGSSAFSYRSDLTSVTIPVSVSSIGENAFKSCPYLKNVYYYSTKQAWDDIAIGSGNDDLKKATIHLLDGIDTVASYQIKSTDKTRLTLQYSFLEDDIEIDNASAEIKVDDYYMYTSPFKVYLNNKETEDYTFGYGKFTIPLGEETAGSIDIVFDKKLESVLTTTAGMIYNSGNKKYTYFVDRIRYNEFITLNAPDTVGSEIISLGGTAPSGTEVKLYIDGTEAETVKANNAGDYKAELDISDILVNEKVYRLRAEYTDFYNITHYAECDVKYYEGLPELEKFTMTYRGVTYDLLSYGKLNITFILIRWGGNYPFTFNVKFKNPIDKNAYITSTRDGIVKFMELEKVSEDGEYVAEGYFEPYEDDYVPGEIAILLAEKAPAIQSSSAEFEDPICPYKRNPFNWSIDPSGYVYAGIDSDRIYNAEVTAYCIPFDSDADDDSFWDSPDESRRIKWDSFEYSQDNPLYTTLDGNYAWDVPEGWWQLEITKDGYEKAVTEWMTVLPPRLDVNINLKTTMAPEIQSAYINGKDIIITFRHAMKVESLKNLTVKDPSGNYAAYSVSYDIEKGENGEELVKRFTVSKDKEITKEYYIVEFTDAENYAGVKGDMTAKAEHGFILGDADGDGEVTIADATAIQRALIKLGNDINRKAADVDGDGAVTVVDATFVQRFATHIPIPYPIGDRT